MSALKVEYPAIVCQTQFITPAIGSRRLAQANRPSGASTAAVTAPPICVQFRVCAFPVQVSSTDLNRDKTIDYEEFIAATTHESKLSRVRAGSVRTGGIGCRHLLPIGF